MEDRYWDEDRHDMLSKCPECGEVFNNDLVDFILVVDGDYVDFFCPSCAYHLQAEIDKKRGEEE
jgi:predicted RNA-binding Zn-ribbon protein involved in translation (DUF1610 family)